MRVVEEYVRATQLPDRAEPRAQVLRPSVTPASTASGGLAAIRPEAQTPFDAYLPSGGTGEEVPPDDPGSDEVTPDQPDDVTGEDPSFPDADEVIPGRPFGVGGGVPDWNQPGGTAPDGSFIGSPPRGGHGSELNIGGGVGAGTGNVGRLYVAGEQVDGEFGLGVAGQLDVAPARLVPGLPPSRVAGAAPRGSYVVSGGGQMSVAGRGVANPSQLLPPLTPNVGTPPSATAYAGRADDAGDLIRSIRAGVFADGGNNRALVSEPRFAVPFQLRHPSQLRSIDLVTFAGISSIDSNRLFTTTTPVVANLYRGGSDAFVAGTAVKVAELSFSSSTPALPNFVRTGGAALLPAGNYTLDVVWPLGQFFSALVTPDAHFVGRTLVNSGSGWTSRSFALEVNIRCGSAEANRTFMRVEQPSFDALTSGNVMLGVRVRLRGVYSRLRVGAYMVPTSRSPSGVYPAELARGYADLDPANFPGGVGFADVFFDAPATQSGDLVLELFGSAVEVGLAQAAVQNADWISARGSRAALNRRLAAAPITAPSAQAVPVPAFGRNLGVSVPAQVLTSFVVSTGLVGFGTQEPVGTDEGGAVSDRTTGETLVQDTDTWSLFLHGGDDPNLTETAPQLLDMDPQDGSALYLRFGRVYGVGSSSTGRLGFSGSTSSLRRSTGPDLVVRGALSPSNGVVQDGSGRLFGAGTGLSGGVNPIPQVGLIASDNPTSVPVFAPIRAEPCGRDAWDVGGDGADRFTLVSDESGTWATGRLTGAFSVTDWTKISNLSFKMIRAGYRHALLLAPNGDLYALGDNTRGQLGLPKSTAFAASPVFVTGGIARAFAKMNKSYILAA